LPVRFSPVRHDLVARGKAAQVPKIALIALAALLRTFDRSRASAVLLEREDGILF